MRDVISHQDLLVFIAILIITFLFTFFLRKYIEKNKTKKWVRVNKEKRTEKTYHRSSESQLKDVDIQDDIFFEYCLSIFFSFAFLIVYIVCISVYVSGYYLTPDGLIVIFFVSIAIICCIVLANKIAHRLYKHIYRE